MSLHTIIQKLIEETQTSSENYLKTESPNDVSPTPHRRPPPGWGPPPRLPICPMECNSWYIWSSILVIIVATVTLVIILFYFCRRPKDRRPSAETIITNIELQNVSQADNGISTAVVPTIVSNKHFKDIGTGGNSTRITIVHKY